MNKKLMLLLTIFFAFGLMPTLEARGGGGSHGGGGHGGGGHGGGHGGHGHGGHGHGRGRGGRGFDGGFVGGVGLYGPYYDDGVIIDDDYDDYDDDTYVVNAAYPVYGGSIYDSAGGAGRGRGHGQGRGAKGGRSGNRGGGHGRK